MKIKYFGHSCFKLTESTGFSALTDPFEKIGYELPKGLTADVVTVSHDHYDHNNANAIEGTPKILREDGAFCFDGVEVVGVKSYHDEKYGALRGENVIYKFRMDGLEICYLGDLGEECSTELVNRLLPVNILLIPIGGKYTIDAKQAKKYVDAIMPDIVIPMHFKTENCNIDIDKAQNFLNEFNAEYVTVSHSDELEFSLENLVQGKIKIILMEKTQ